MPRRVEALRHSDTVPPADSAQARLEWELGVEPGRLTDLDPELIYRIEARVNALREAAAVDESTGVLTRGAGLAALQREVERAHRHGDKRLVVGLLDGAGLRRADNGDGHTVALEVAVVLQRRLRASDLIMRWGGSQFVCALPHSGLEHAQRVLQEVDAGFAQHTGGRLSFGLAEIGLADTAEELVSVADADLRGRRRAARRIGVVR